MAAINYKAVFGLYALVIVGMTLLFVYKPTQERVFVEHAYFTEALAQEEDVVEIIELEDNGEIDIRVADQLVSADAIGAQNIDDAIEANKEIYGLGLSTRDQKLFQVEAILNADTLVLKDFGVVRAIGINAPNSKQGNYLQECFAHEAVLHARNILNEGVYLEFDQQYRIDQYGRTLAYIYLPDGTLYNKEMIRWGYVFTFKDYLHKKAGEFSSEENTAISEDQGLWQKNTCNGKAFKLRNWK